MKMVALLLFTVVLATAQSRSFPALEKRLDGKLEVIARMDQRPGNLAITPEGRMLLSIHPFAAPDVKVVELKSDGTLVPFPNQRWASSPGADGIGFDAVIGIEADRQGIVWMLDKGGVDGRPAKLIAWNTRRNHLERVIHIPPPVFRPNSFIQDLAIDDRHDAVYLADMSRGDLVGESDPAIIVVDLKTGRSWRALHSHPSLQASGDAFEIDGKAIEVAGKVGRKVRPALGLNPITLDAECNWVYYGAMNGTALWRVSTDDLLNVELSAEDLRTRVQKAGSKPVSDGITIDREGNVYVTDVNNNAIGVTDRSGAYSVVVQDAALSWADGLTFGADGWLYATVNQLHRHPILNGGTDASKPPFTIVRFKPSGKPLLGR